MEKGSKILLTGATGFTGSYVLRKLVADGMQVRAIARESSNITPFEDLEVDWFRGDVFDADVIREATKNIDYIFHIAAAFREAKVADDYYRKVHVDSTKLLARAASEQPNFKRFIHTSTIGVHSHIANPPANEDYPFNPDDIYQRTKAEAELWIRKYSEEYDLPLVVVRPAGIFGPGDKRLLKLFKFAKKGKCLLLNKHDTLYHLIHVEDLADFHLLCATHPEALGDTFICGNKVNTSVREIVDCVQKYMKYKPVRYFSLPAAPLFILGDVCEFLFKPFGVEPPIYRRRVAFFTKDRSFDTSKMQKKLGFLPKRDNKTGIEETAEWYKNKGWL